MDAATRVFEEGEEGKVVQVQPSWISEESLDSLCSKFPLIPGSQDSIVFCTTLLTKKLQQRSEEDDFDLSDNHTVPYNCLHDPHLKSYFHNPEMRKSLVEKGFITDDGYIKCNLMEFNNYRKWVRKVKLDKLHRQRRVEREEDAKKKKEMVLQKKCEREQDRGYVLKERERKAKETADENEKRRMQESKKLMKRQELETKKREKQALERRRFLEDTDLQREKNQLVKKTAKLKAEQQHQKIRSRFLKKQEREHKKRLLALEERKRFLKKQNENKLKSHWKRRCAETLKHIKEHHDEEVHKMEKRMRNIERRGTIFDKKQHETEEALINFMETRRASLQKELLEAEELLEKLRIKKEHDLCKWKQNYELMKSKECVLRDRDDYVRWRRWSDVGAARYARLKSTWDLRSSLGQLGEELWEEQMALKAFRERKSQRKQVRALIWNIIDNAYDIIQQEDERKLQVEQQQSQKQQVRRYVFSVIENARQTLEKERILERQSYMVRAARELVTASIAYAQRCVDKIETQKTKTATELHFAQETNEEIKSGELARCEDNMDCSVRNIVHNAIASAVDSMERLFYEDVDHNEAAMNLIRSAVVRAQESLEDIFRITPALEDQVHRAAWRLANNAMLEARNSFEALHEENIRTVARQLTSSAIISAQNSIERMEEAEIWQTAEELALEAIVNAHNTLTKNIDEKFFAEELGRRAVLEVKVSLQRAEELDRTSRELALKAIESAQTSASESDCELNEARRLAILAAKKSIEMLQNHDSLDTRQSMIASEATSLAVKAIRSAEGSLEDLKKAYQKDTINKGEIIQNVMEYVERIILSAIRRLEETNEIQFLMPGHIEHVYLNLREEDMVSSPKQLGRRGSGIGVKARELVENALASAIGIVTSSKTSKVFSSFSRHSTPGTSSQSRRRSSVHFSNMSVLSNRRASYVPREGDFVPVTNRPPTPRFLGRNTTGTDSMDWEKLEKELQIIEDEDEVRVLSIHNIPFRGTRRCSSFQYVERLPRKVKFAIHHSASDPSCSSNTAETKPSRMTANSFLQLLRSSDSKATSTGNISKSDSQADEESHPCEISSRDSSYVLLPTLTSQEKVSINTKESDTVVAEGTHLPAVSPTPSLVSDDGSSKGSQASLTRRKRKESVRSSERSDKLPHLSKSGSTVSPKPSEKMSKDAAGSRFSASKTSVTKATHKSSTNVIKVIPSTDVANVTTKQSSNVTNTTSTDVAKVTPTSSTDVVGRTTQPSTDAAKIAPKQSTDVVKVATKPSTEVAKVSVKPSTDVAKISPKPSTNVSTISPKPSTDVSAISPKPSTDVSTISPKPSKHVSTISPKPSTDVAKVSPKPSTEVAKLSPKPSTDVAKVSPKPSTYVSTISPKPSTDVAKLSPKPSTDAAKVSPKPSREVVKISPKPSTDVAKISPKPSRDVAKLSPRTSTGVVKISPKPSTDVAKISPKPSRDVAKLSTRTSTDVAKISQKPSTSVARISPKPSTDVAKISPKPSTDVAKISPKLSTDAAKISPKPSTDVTNVSPKPSRDIPKVSPKQSMKVAKVSDKSITDIPRVPSKPSTNVSPKSSTDVAQISSKPSTNVSPKSSTDVAKVSVKSSTAVAKVSTKLSPDVAKISSKSSTEAVKVTPKPSTEDARISPKSSTDGVKVTQKPSTDVVKLAAKSSNDAAKISAKPSKDASKVASKTFKDDVKMSSKSSTDAAQVASSSSNVPSKVSTVPASKSSVKVDSKIMSKTTVEVTPKSSKDLATKSSSKTVKVTTKLSSGGMSSKQSTEKVTSKASTESTKIASKSSKNLSKASKNQLSKSTSSSKASKSEKSQTDASPPLSKDASKTSLKRVSSKVSKSKAAVTQGMKTSTTKPEAISPITSEVSTEKSKDSSSESAKPPGQSKSSSDVLPGSSESSVTVSLKQSDNESKSPTAISNESGSSRSTEVQASTSKVKSDVSQREFSDDSSSGVTTKETIERVTNAKRGRIFSEDGGYHEASDNRRISLTVPDTATALKGIGRRASLPLGVLSEEEQAERRASITTQLAELSKMQSMHAKEPEVVHESHLPYAVPSIAVVEPTTPPNEDNVLFDESERQRIIQELEEHTVSNSSLYEADILKSSSKEATKAMESGKGDIKPLGKNSSKSLKDMSSESTDRIISIVDESDTKASVKVKSDGSNMEIKPSVVGEASSNSSVKQRSPASDVHSKTSKASFQKESPQNTAMKSKTSIAVEVQDSPKSSTKIVNTKMDSPENHSHEPRPCPCNSLENVSVVGAPATNSKHVLESLACVGVQLSSTDSGNNVCTPRRSSELGLKDNLSSRSIPRQSIELLGSSEMLSRSFELKGTGLGSRTPSEHSTGSNSSNRSSKYSRPLPLTSSRQQLPEGSIAQGVVVTPLKPSPPLSPKLIESSVRRSKLKLALSRQSATETKSETSLQSSRSGSGTKSHESLQKVSSTGMNVAPDRMISATSMSSRHDNAAPARSNTSSGVLGERIKPERSRSSPSTSQVGSEKDVKIVAIGHSIDKPSN